MSKKSLKKEDPTSIYTLIEKMGSGSYGTVWKAIKQSDKSIHAIKIVRKSDRGENSEVIKEIKFLMACNHSNVVKYYESYDREDELWVRNYN